MFFLVVYWFNHVFPFARATNQKEETHKQCKEDMIPSTKYLKKVPLGIGTLGHAIPRVSFLRYRYCMSFFFTWFFLSFFGSVARASPRRNQIKDKTIHLNTSTSVILSQIRSWCLNEKVVSCRGKAWLWPLSRQLTNLFIHNFYLLVQVRLR